MISPPQKKQVFAGPLLVFYNSPTLCRWKYSANAIYETELHLSMSIEVNLCSFSFHA